MRVTSADGTAIVLHVSGPGPDVVFVHGSAADHQDWSLVRPLFEPSFHVAAMDRRGRGASGDGPAYALEREAEDLIAVTRALRGPAVVAHSYGALVALEAARLGAPMRRLVLYEPPFFAEPQPTELSDMLDKLVAAGESDRALETFLREAAGMSDEEISLTRAEASIWASGVQSAPTLGRELRVSSTFRFDAARYRNVSVPTLLLTGSESPAFFGEAIRAMDAALPESRIVELEGQAHGALMAAPHRLADAVESFLL